MARTLVGLHADPYSSKFPALARQTLEHVGGAVTNQRCRGARGGCQQKLRTRSIRDTDLRCEGGRQEPSQKLQERELVLAPIDEAGERGLSDEDVAQWAHA